MKTFFNIIPLFAVLATCCTPREVEQITAPASAQNSSVSAYIVETKTGYTIDEGARKAVFAWLEGDRIDIPVNTGPQYVSVPFTSTEAGPSVKFLDGVTPGEPTLAELRASYPEAELSPRAFYPSGYGWSIDSSDGITLSLPVGSNYDASNPLAAVPLLGTRDGDGAYAFSPATAVLAIPVTGITAEMDFISLESGEAGLSGDYSVETNGELSPVTPVGAVSLSFSGLSGDYTFYFPLPAGTIPAGLVITCGSSTDAGNTVRYTVSNAIELTRGRIARSGAIPAPEQWEVVTTEGKFLDDFLWGAHNSFTAGTYVPVTIERSSRTPGKFRIANPYSAACGVFGYTPYTDGIVADPYLVFTVADDGSVTFPAFRCGMEDKDSGGRPMQLNHPTSFYPSRTGKESKVLWFSSSDATMPVSVQLGCVYSDPSDASYFYSRDGEGHSSADRVHILFSDEPEPVEGWESVGTGRYRDEFFWNGNAFPPMDVPVEIFRSTVKSGSYRIPNPYTVAAAAFLRSGYSGDEFLYFSIDSSGAVSFEPVVTGMTYGSNNRNYAIKEPGNMSASKVVSGSASAPQEVVMGSVFYDSADASHYYTRANYDMRHLYFPAFYEAETWTDVAEGSYQDLPYDARINGSSAIGTVGVTIQQSQSDSRRYRIANPYRGAVESTYLRSTYDQYLYFTVGGNGLVFFDTFRPGLALNPSVNSAYELGIAHPAASNLLGYSQGGSDFSGNSVLSTLSDGSPKKVQLGAHYYDIAGPTPSYCYTRHGSAWTDERIFISFAQEDKAYVEPYRLPILAAFHNPVTSLSLPSGSLQKLVVKISGGDISKVTGLRLWQNAQGGWMDSGYVAPDASGLVSMTDFSNPTVSGDIDLNFWMEGLDFGDGYLFDVQEVVIDGTSYAIEQDNSYIHHMGVRVNNGGDVVNVRGSSETVASFRIPALVTSNEGTLIAAYDVRYAHSGDLQADIDVGMKRSTDGGKTWSDLQLIMDMGEYGGLGQSQNGIGDPCLLVDENTGRLFCFAVWAYGNSGACLGWAGTGYDISSVPQYMMVYSDDDGLSWSEPVNITAQVKQEDWRMTFQGPGRGITMKDGTLVVPMQHQEGSSRSMHGYYPLNSGIMYSKDHGATWTSTNIARTVTSESAVAEIEPGVLMLSMRDETDSKTRAVYTTTDLGVTWTAHSTDKKVIEPTCQASLLHVDASANSLRRDLLLFSNPHSQSGRIDMTIQASLDKGASWSHSLLLDAGGSLGYSCLTMVDESTVGILYESSRGSILFQAVPLTDIIR